MKTVRCFLAVNLTIDSATQLAEYQRALETQFKGVDGTVRWVPAQNFHVTLRFLGAITEPMIQALKDQLAPVTRSVPPFSFQCEPAATFMNGDSPTILYTPVSAPDDGISRLYEQVATVMEENGFKASGAPYVPHVTLGRLNDLTGEAASQAIASCEVPQFTLGQVADLLCYQSELAPAGADYRLLWRLPLLGRAQANPQPDNNPPEPSDDSSVEPQREENAPQ